MNLAQLRQQARGWLLDLADALCDDEHTLALQHEVDALQARLRRAYRDLLPRRRRLEQLHSQLAEQEQLALALPWKVEAYLQTGNRALAWLAALELDRLRQALAADREQLRLLEQAYHDEVRRLEQERTRLGQLQRQLFRLHPDPGLRTA